MRGRLNFGASKSFVSQCAVFDMHKELASFYIQYGQVTLESVTDFPTFQQYCSYLPKSPSRHSISELFLADFDMRKEIYYQHMRATTITDDNSWLSCDHTFACAGM